MFLWFSVSRKHTLPRDSAFSATYLDLSKKLGQGQNKQIPLCLAASFTSSRGIPRCSLAISVPSDVIPSVCSGCAPGKCPKYHLWPTEREGRGRAQKQVLLPMCPGSTPCIVHTPWEGNIFWIFESQPHHTAANDPCAHWSSNVDKTSRTTSFAKSMPRRATQNEAALLRITAELVCFNKCPRITCIYIPGGNLVVML